MTTFRSVSRRTWRAGGLGLVTLALLAAQAGAATGAALDWSKVSAQTPPGTPYSIFFATLACPSKTMCWATGSANTAKGVSPVLERLHKGKFHAVSTPVAHATLEGVVCRSTRNCVLAGSVAGATTTKPILEKWNGHKWSKVAAPNPKGNDNELLDPACPSAHLCMVVGWYGDSTVNPITLHPLLERSTGKKWSIAKAPPVPSDAQSASLNALNCVSKTSCIAIGSFIPKGGFDSHTYADRLHGKKWSLMTVPQPFQGTYAYAADSDVKCSSAKSCVMTGYAAPDAQGRTSYTPEAWSYNGTKWKLLTLPKSFVQAGGAFDDVACSSSSTCWLIGFEYSSSAGATGRAYAMRWNGHKLTAAAAIAQPSGGFSELDGDGCVHHGECYALGDNTQTSGKVSAFADRAG
ncbi:MAG TPA: hypothetical protein VME70_03845 [Mycobacteriales bacterium]|nr:hypothetical protein [Mycobacteriales bacterium]